MLQPKPHFTPTYGVSMLNNPQEVKEFKDYQAAGGLQQPPGYHKAIATVPLAEQVKSQLSGAVSSDVDYNADGINDLPAIMLTLSNESGEALIAANAMITYLDIAANTTDIEQVAIGVGIVRKLAGVEDKEPAPSIIPITNADDITALHAGIVAMHSNVADAVALMDQINTALTPAPAIPPAPALPAPPLPDKLKQQALAMIATLEPMTGSITSKAVIVMELTEEATSERLAAIDAFNDCIAFTMLNGQKSKPSVSGAANAMYPKVKY